MAAQEISRKRPALFFLCLFQSLSLRLEAYLGTALSRKKKNWTPGSRRFPTLEPTPDPTPDPTSDPTHLHYRPGSDIDHDEQLRIRHAFLRHAQDGGATHMRLRAHGAAHRPGKGSVSNLSLCTISKPAHRPRFLVPHAIVEENSRPLFSGKSEV